MRIKENYLDRVGYRLPTEAEWEIACRAGTLTCRYYGTSDALLCNYAWYQMNANDQSHPVASLKPNDNGLFDIQGNVWEWCQGTYQLYGTEDDEADADRQPVNDSASRILRGGSFNLPTGFTRSACRSYDLPSLRYSFFNGFRPARTLP